MVHFGCTCKLRIPANHAVRELGIEPFQRPEDLEEQRRPVRCELHRPTRPAEAAGQAFIRPLTYDADDTPDLVARLRFRQQAPLKPEQL